jgi:hypothetical protein
VRPLRSGLFDTIDDDAILIIMHVLVALSTDTAPGLALQAAVVQGARCLRALLLSCKRMPSALCHQGALLRKEMAARASTQIAPRLDTMYPFTAQMRRESRSSGQLEALRKAIASMATHCAGPCCARVQQVFNRQPGTARVLSIMRRSALTAASPSGNHVFVSSRRRFEGLRMKQREQNLASSLEGRHTGQWLQHIARETGKELHSVELTDTDQFSTPHNMRACHDGTCVALVRAVHSAYADEHIPHSVVHVWDTAARTISNHGIEPPWEADSLGAINAQDTWWLAASDSCQRQLAVLWSTGYVHPMGTVVGANADNACYFIAVYTPRRGELQVSTGPFTGKAQTVSPDGSGENVAVLVRKRPIGAGPGSLATATRCTMMHNVWSDTARELTHTGAIAAGRGRVVSAHPYDTAQCPSAVALSPPGDCVVAVHRRALSVLVEVLLRTGPGVFVSVQTIDVTHWTAIGRSEPTVFDHPDDASVADNLKLPYKVSFSPCGRFAAVVDQRPLFGLAVNNHALLVLDMALRHERRGVRALPLAPVEDMAPRSIEWTENGLWLQPKYGCLLLEA